MLMAAHTPASPYSPRKKSARGILTIHMEKNLKQLGTNVSPVPRMAPLATRLAP